MIGAGYLVSFVCLAWVSYFYPLNGSNITLWNPQPALAVAMLLWRRRAAPWVFASLAITEMTIGGLPAVGWVTLASSTAQTLVYFALATALHRAIGRSLIPRNARELLAFTAAVMFGALMSGTAYVGAIVLADGLVVDSPLVMLGRYWIGESVGMFVTLPVVGLLADAARRRHALVLIRGIQWWPIGAATIALVAIMFFTPASGFRAFHLLIVPVAWAALRFGVNGAILAAALTQASIIAAVQVSARSALTVMELQVLVETIGLTGLLLGLVVDDRTRAFSDLGRTLHMASAGQMASALAHELGQPLTALRAYAHACRDLVASRNADIDPLTRAKLGQIAATLVTEANRAGEVMDRLGAPLSGGTPARRIVPAARLLTEAMSSHRRRSASLGIQLDISRIAPHLQVEVDVMQIEVVLRNLISNAIDAVMAIEGPRRVALHAIVASGMLRVEVRDNGAGVDRSRLDTLFETVDSEKPEGMGIGLAISRAIIEKHHGRLWAKPGPGGLFAFTLPLAADSEAASTAPESSVARST